VGKGGRGVEIFHRVSPAVPTRAVATAWARRVIAEIKLNAPAAFAQPTALYIVDCTIPRRILKE
jgi:hypothetical protein